MADEPKDLFAGPGTEDYRQAAWLGQRLRQRWRYDHTAERWHHWDGSRWAPDDGKRIHAEVARVAGAQLGKGGGGESETRRLTELLKWPVQERALKALSTLDGYGTNGDDWDSDPYLLGVKGGIVDLRLNALVPKPTPDMLVTKSTKVAFHPLKGPAEFKARAPEFMKFMDQITSKDASMTAFLLLWYGASLFGFTPEQRFLLMVGIGRNGKGTLKHSIIKAVGEYGAQSDANLYMRSKFGAARSDQARADLLAIKGKRITFFSEPEGNRFNEEMLKAHTGGDRITARALHSNNVQSWDPTHSITFLVNNAPEVEDLGPSMAARVMVADFRERYDGEKEDKKLYGILEGEAEGILAILCWAAQAWYTSWRNGGGITLPDRVVEQSRQFMERNDAIANWLNERGEYGRDFTSPSQVAYDSYLNWHERSGEPGDPMSNVRWALAMQKKGLTKRKTIAGMVWTGFRLLGAMALADKGIDEDEAP
jgi:putative DNA primase/helicase